MLGIEEIKNKLGEKYNVRYEESTGMVIINDADASPHFSVALNLSDLENGNMTAVSYYPGNPGNGGRRELDSEKVVGTESYFNTQEGYARDIVNNNGNGTMAIVSGRSYDNTIGFNNGQVGLGYYVDDICSKLDIDLNNNVSFGFSDGGEGATDRISYILNKNPDAKVSTIYIDSTHAYERLDNPALKSLKPGQFTAMYIAKSNSSYEDYKTIQCLEEYKADIIFVETDYAHGTIGMANPLLEQNVESLLLGHPEKFDNSNNYKFTLHTYNVKTQRYEEHPCSPEKAAELLSGSNNISLNGNTNIDKNKKEIDKNGVSDTDVISSNLELLDSLVSSVISNISLIDTSLDSYGSTTKIPSVEPGVLSNIITSANNLFGKINSEFVSIKNIGTQIEEMDSSLSNSFNSKIANMINSTLNNTKKDASSILNLEIKSNVNSNSIPIEIDYSKIKNNSILSDNSSNASSDKSVSSSVRTIFNKQNSPLMDEDTNKINVSEKELVNEPIDSSKQDIPDNRQLNVSLKEPNNQQIISEKELSNKSIVSNKETSNVSIIPENRKAVDDYVALNDDININSNIDKTDDKRFLKGVVGEGGLGALLYPFLKKKNKAKEMDDEDNDNVE